jgi:hypothetical protein
MHLRNIFNEGELEANSVVKKSLTTAADGKKYQTNFYDLSAILAVGYRVKSAVAKVEKSSPDLTPGEFDRR